MNISGFGFVTVLACKLACIAACTAVVLSLDHTAARDGPRWVDQTIVSTGAASAACALAVICFQIYRAFSGTASRAGVALAAAGAAAHTAMLAALSLYWSFFHHKTYYRSGSGADGRRTVVHLQVNYFDYYGRWSDEEAALYALGCLAGVAAWLMALAASYVDTRRAAKQLTSGRMPLAASAPHAASHTVNVIAEQLVPATPRTPSSLALCSPRAATPVHADALLLPGKAAAALEADALVLPGTPTLAQHRAAQT